MSLISKPLFWVILLFVFLLAAVFLYGRSTKKVGGEHIKLKEDKGDNGTPNSWTPYADAAVLFNAMDGYGTDEESIWNTLEGKTDGQLRDIYNEYGSKYGVDLFDSFRGDLEGEELSRAMNYFKNLTF